MKNLSLAVICLVWAAVELNLPSADAFLPPKSPSKIATTSSTMWMGLYDTPLPTRPPPRDDERNDRSNDVEEDELTLLPQQVLFSMQDDGTEAQALLPPLSRRLDTGIGCYFEVTDRKVQNLAAQANCNPIDAAWALEACKGELVEARTCISVAQRQALESIPVELRQTQNMEMDECENDDEVSLERSKEQQQSDTSGVDLDGVKADLYDMLREDEWEELAEERRKNRIYEKRMDAFKLSKKDAQWLPNENPRPVDDEPWFTG